MKKVLLITAVAAAMFSCGSQNGEISIVPAPSQMEARSGFFRAKGAQVSYDAALDERSVAVVERFAGHLSKATGKAATPQSGALNKGFVFSADTSVPAEGYTLSIDRKAVRIGASDAKGFLNAVQTIGQLMPTDWFADEPGRSVRWVLPQLTITDTPRFGYRGLHLDVARHFFAVNEVKKYLDFMALYKMNRFHWHLTDDQGWRIEIKRYPRLTEVGSRRLRESLEFFEKEPVTGNETPYGGYFTQDEIREVVAYADSLGITVIPEIDLPGHMVAALAAYPELGCTGGPYEVRPTWGLSDDALCPGKEGTFRFLEDVLTEVMELFPGEYIHIGGDECSKVIWAKCPDCQRRIRQLGLRSDDHFSKEQYLQAYVTARIQRFLADHGRKIIGWEEILEGELGPGATVMSWRGAKAGIKAAQMGLDVIMSPTTHFYLDYYQSAEDKEAESPRAIGGFLPVDTSYTFRPLDGIPEQFHKHVLGVQGNLWTEFIATPKHLEYMLIPRGLALAEAQWSNEDRKDFERFKAALPHQFEILENLGYTCCYAIFGHSGLE